MEAFHLFWSFKESFGSSRKKLYRVSCPASIHNIFPAGERVFTTSLMVKRIAPAFMEDEYMIQALKKIKNNHQQVQQVQ
jgi:hypothetical protein